MLEDCGRLDSAASLFDFNFIISDSVAYYSTKSISPIEFVALKLYEMEDPTRFYLSLYINI